MMESVLHTLIIILFILIPGFIFRRIYFQGGFSTQFDSKSWSHSIFYSILFGLIIEIISTCIFAKYIKAVEGNSIADFYECISDNQIPLWIFDVNILKNLLYFFLILFATSFILGQASYHFVRRLKLDRRFLFLRFNNHWHYYFTGEIKDFKEFKHISGTFQCSHIDVLVNTDDGKNILYTGFLSSHTINSTTGDLEAIYLTIPSRYDLDAKMWKSIKSDVLIIPYSKVINLNIRFTFKEKKKFKISLKFLTPLFPLIFLFISAFIWWDYYDFLSANNWVSKLIIKILLQITWLLIFTFIFTLYPNKSLEINRKQRIANIKAIGYLTFLFVLLTLAVIYLIMLLK